MRMRESKTATLSRKLLVLNSMINVTESILIPKNKHVDLFLDQDKAGKRYPQNLERNPSPILGLRKFHLSLRGFTCAFEFGLGEKRGPVGGMA